ncbi:hypothetical protein TNCV_683231 [Trichonephila clavipes]|nr:hypothetical protein TNCV_683231 [Trichonephila clavipes]
MIRHERCRFFASGKSTDLVRGRTRNLGRTKRTTNQLRPPSRLVDLNPGFNEAGRAAFEMEWNGISSRGVKVGGCSS